MRPRLGLDFGGSSVGLFHPLDCLPCHALPTHFSLCSIWHSSPGKIPHPCSLQRYSPLTFRPLDNASPVRRPLTPETNNRIIEPVPGLCFTPALEKVGAAQCPARLLRRSSCQPPLLQCRRPRPPPGPPTGGPGALGRPPFPPSVCAIPLKVPGSRLRETEYFWFPTFPAAGPAAAPFFKERGPRGPSALPSSAGAAEAVALLMAPPLGSRRAYVLTVSAQGLGPCYRALFFPRPSARAIAAPDSTTSDVLPLCTALTE